MISILIAAHNAEKFITETIENVLCQTYGNIEVLVVDDASRDGTWNAILAASKQDSRLRVYRSERNLGPYGALNFLLPLAQGEYIAIQDHDDLWHPEKLSRQIEFLENHTEYIGCGTNTLMFFEEDRSYFEYRFPSESFYTLHPSLLFRNTPGLMYPESEAYMGDAYFQKYSLCQKGRCLGNMPEVLTYHRIRGEYSNASFSWFTWRSSCVKRLFQVHGFSFYAFLALGFEIMRKLVYPILRRMKKWHWMTVCEQVPFRIMGCGIQRGTIGFGSVLIK